MTCPACRGEKHEGDCQIEECRVCGAWHSYPYPYVPHVVNHYADDDSLSGKVAKVFLEGIHDGREH